MEKISAIVVPGGGLSENGAVTPWVERRLDHAIMRWKECTERLAQRTCDSNASSGCSDTCLPKIITLSAGTSHKPPPRDCNGFPVFESCASADFLIKAGIPSSCVLMEWSSYDTIGNAYFARTQHTDVLGLRTLLVITSEFHMPRTRAIFEWVFSLPVTAQVQSSSPLETGYNLMFEDVPDSGTMALDTLESRRTREAQSLQKLQAGAMKTCTDLRSLHAFLFNEHAAYAAGKAFQRSQGTVSESVLKTY
eukprot:scpid79204/ scgid29810/ 